MSGVPTRLLAAAIVVGAALTATLVGPSVALADCNGGTSAVNVYKECLPSGGAGKSKAGGHTSRSHQAGNGMHSKPSHLSGRATKALSHAGKDKSALTKLISYGQRRRLQASQPGSQQAPSAVGSAFDLGSGPTALLIVLASAAFLLLGASGLRGWRRWHRG